MATPTRLPVLLQSRKSARAGVAPNASSALAKIAAAKRLAMQCLAWVNGKWVTLPVAIDGGFDAGRYALSTTMARKSLTLVKVGPGAIRSPKALKNPVE